MSSSTLPTDLPILTDIIDTDDSIVSIPTLTEIIPVLDAPESITPLDISEPIDFRLHQEAAIEPAVEAAAYSPQPPATTERSLNSAEMQLILDHFSHHLETVFTEKLDRHLRQLHHQAVHLAIAELKAELPELLHNLLHSTDSNN